MKQLLPKRACWWGCDNNTCWMCIGFQLGRSKCGSWTVAWIQSPSGCYPSCLGVGLNSRAKADLRVENHPEEADKKDIIVKHIHNFVADLMSVNK